uniref:Putative NagD-like phosphatase n=1 Tax=uncultured bacterium contig00006 TaxID=1181498 RepID=A0A806JZ80_9BACT|nr:putative NagD-like phosphatase [uncultured bacterium contig00006]
MRRLNEIRLFLLDMDGTVYIGDRLFSCTLPLLQRLDANGVGRLFLTNNSSKDKADYIAKLNRLGVAASERHILTSGDAAIDYLKEKLPGAAVYLVGTASLQRAFEAAGIALTDCERCDAAVVGFDTELTYNKLEGLYRAVASGRRYICTHPDMLCPAENGFIPDIGATIAYIEALTSRRPDVVIGKPERYMIDAAAKRFCVGVDEIAVVGDRLYTDMELARRAGATSVLVLSGETTKEQALLAAEQPDYIFDDLSGITDLL